MDFQLALFVYSRGFIFFLGFSNHFKNPSAVLFQVLQDRATQEHSGGVVGKSQPLLLDNGTMRQHSSTTNFHPIARLAASVPAALVEKESDFARVNDS